MVRNGPGYNPEKAPDVKQSSTQKYPKAKKGAEIKCLGCKNGKVMGPSNVVKDCEACKGQGTITV